MCEESFFLVCFASNVLPGSPGSADPMLDVIIQEKLKGISREASDRNDKYRKCKQLLMVKLHPCVNHFLFQTFLFTHPNFNKLVQ